MNKQFFKGICAAAVALFITMFAMPQKAQAQAKEAYAAFDKGTLTFYFDNKKATHATKYDLSENSADLPEWAGRVENPNTSIKTVKFDASFKNYKVKTTSGWFFYLSGLTSVLNIENLNTSETTAMHEMFAGCFSLRSLDLSKLDTRNVEDMLAMFYACRSLVTLNLKNLNTSKVVTMASMFSDCRSLKSLNLSSFDTSKVKDMSNMFNGCLSLTTLDLSGFNTSATETMRTMFEDCSSLTTLNLLNFKTVVAEDLTAMFYGCTSLTTIYCENTWKAKDSGHMFHRCIRLKGKVAFDAGKTDVSMANPDNGYFTRKVSTGIASVASGEATVKEIYTANGSLVPAMQRGLNILHMSDGTIRKVIRK